MSIAFHPGTTHTQIEFYFDIQEALFLPLKMSKENIDTNIILWMII